MLQWVEIETTQKDAEFAAMLEWSRRRELLGGFMLPGWRAFVLDAEIKVAPNRIHHPEAETNESKETAEKRVAHRCD